MFTEQVNVLPKREKSTASSPLPVTTVNFPLTGNVPRETASSNTSTELLATPSRYTVVEVLSVVMVRSTPLQIIVRTMAGASRSSKFSKRRGGRRLIRIGFPRVDVLDVPIMDCALLQSIYKEKTAQSDLQSIQASS